MSGNENVRVTEWHGVRVPVVRIVPGKAIALKFAPDELTAPVKDESRCIADICDGHRGYTALKGAVADLVGKTVRTEKTGVRRIRHRIVGVEHHTAAAALGEVDHAQSIPVDILIVVQHRNSDRRVYVSRGCIIG